MRRTPGYPESMHCYEPFCTESAPHAAAVVRPRRRPAQKHRNSHRTPHQPKRRRMSDPELLEDTATPSPPRARQRNEHACLRRWKGARRCNVRRPPAVPGTASPHVCRYLDSRRAPTPHLRTPHAPSRSPETRFSAYVRREPATLAIRSWPVHMAWDRET